MMRKNMNKEKPVYDQYDPISKKWFRWIGNHCKEYAPEKTFMSKSVVSYDDRIAKAKIEESKKICPLVSINSSKYAKCTGKMCVFFHEGCELINGTIAEGSERKCPIMNKKCKEECNFKYGLTCKLIKRN